MAQPHPLTLRCNIYDWGGNPPAPPESLRLENVHCNAQPIRTYQTDANVTTLFNLHIFIYLPAGTDVRYQPADNTGDTVEFPAGSGFWLRVRDVVDFNKGTENEQRRALCLPELRSVFPMP